MLLAVLAVVTLMLEETKNKDILVKIMFIGLFVAKMDLRPSDPFKRIPVVFLLYVS